MRILAISPVPLYPVRTGLELRIYNFLEPLCERHQVSQISFALATPPTAEEQAHMESLFEHVVYVDQEEMPPEPVSKVQQILSWFSPRSVSFGPAGDSQAMKERLEQLLEENDFDVLFVASAFVLNYVLGIYKPPAVFDAIDDTSLLFKRDIRRKQGLIEKIKGYKDWLIIRQTEKKFYSRFKEIILSSPTDAATMKSLCPNSNITVIPNGVNAHEYDREFELNDKPTLVFTGVMNYGPNAEAMLYFCREIFPLLQVKHPELELYIVGRDPTPAVIDLGKRHEKVTVTGPVDDLKAYIGKAWVYVCPLISGAGIKNKVLESWAARTPLVATSLSCEGIDVAPGEDILVADTPVEFANQVTRLIEDRALADRLAKAGREKVLNQYDWESKARAVEAILEKQVAAFNG